MPLYTPSIYPSVHNLQIRTLFEDRPVYQRVTPNLGLLAIFFVLDSVHLDPKMYLFFFIVRSISEGGALSPLNHKKTFFHQRNEWIRQNEQPRSKLGGGVPGHIVVPPLKKLFVCVFLCLKQGSGIISSRAVRKLDNRNY